jgi:hypothetical protein
MSCSAMPPATPMAPMRVSCREMSSSDCAGVFTVEGCVRQICWWTRPHECRPACGREASLPHRCSSSCRTGSRSRHFCWNGTSARSWSRNRIQAADVVARTGVCGRGRGEPVNDGRAVVPPESQGGGGHREVGRAGACDDVLAVPSAVERGSRYSEPLSMVKGLRRLLVPYDFVDEELNIQTARPRYRH